MHEICTYRIEVQDQVDKNDLNAHSPLLMAVLAADPVATQLTVRTDQSGLIGLMRHLHGRGLVLLSVACER